ncbi:hypothetical protein [Leptolyngbya ohadii]|uniref:hypothetical protein n=1 Tax=Leptolyngbya ohadii TaxID=1962290 RepID=UPI000B59D254|nr:hypothetical protein [Leptolyngbya ohadii]
MAKAAGISRRLNHQLNHQRGIWISLLIPLWFGLVSLAYRLSHQLIVQDDQRLHLVWLQQWIDPQLFQNDLIARYYQSIQPIGFRAFYWFAAQIGIEPVVLAAVLPLILALISSFFLYRLTFRLLPHPLAPLIAVLLFNQNIWCKDDLVSASPRSFAYPLLILFLDAITRFSVNSLTAHSSNGSGVPQNWGVRGQFRIQQSPFVLAIACLLILTLQGLFYPQIMLVSLGVLWLRLLSWRQGKLRLSCDRFDYGLASAGLMLTGIILLFFSQTASEFGDIFSAEQMRSMPEFLPGGRRVYFGVSSLRFWFAGASGLRFPLFPPILWAAAGLPLICAFKKRSASEQVSSPRPEITVLAQVLLAQVILASIGLFALAHLTFPLLYLPSRYTFYSSRVVLPIAAGITLTILIDRFWQWLRLRKTIGLTLRERMLTNLVALLAIVVVIVPAMPPLFLSNQGWITGTESKLYSFLSAQPESSVIASVANVTDNIPAFSQRSVLFSPELAMPYHANFYQQMQQRITDIIQAQYSQNLSTVKSVIEKYKIDLWIVESESFNSDYLLSQSWLMNSSMRSIVQIASTALQQQESFVLRELSQQCTVFSEGLHSVIDADCILQHSISQRPNGMNS